jgi:MFS family permease
MVALLTGHARRLSFGLFTAFASSFGQTFFIALSVPYILAELAMGEGRFGVLYAVATLTSGLSLPFVGRLIDRMPLRLYTSLTVIGLSAAALAMALAQHAFALAAAILGLRLAGQGVMGHISQTVMARDFTRNRGKALGLAGLGYPLGEAMLPGLFVAAAALVGWRGTWLAIAVLAMVVLLPLGIFLGHSQRPSEADHGEARVTLQRLTFRDLISDRAFRLVLPALMVTPLLLTALFLYNAVLGQAKGWSPAWLATAFTGYAVCRALASLGVGPVIDRWTARGVLPLYLIPLFLGLAILSTGASNWIALAYLCLVGLTSGASSSVMSALWAEMYGPSQVAAVRSVTAGLTITSTAISPPIIGLLLERGVGFDAIQYGGMLLIVGASVLAWWAVRRDRSTESVPSHADIAA